MNSRLWFSLLISFSLLFIPDSLFCQELLTGTIVSKENGEPIPNANICIYESGSRNVMGFAFSANDGTFCLKPKSASKSFFLEVTLMGYQKFGKNYISFPSEALVIRLEPGDIRLNEIKVSAPKVSVAKDTINYTTAAFSKEQDKSIGDVLKRIPGIDVSKSGQVTYKEKPINALYIDDKNLLDGQYGIATQNIRPDLVSMIQIFENHQPIKVLGKFSPSGNAAINLKLNKSARSQWISYVDLGAGVKPILWNEKLLLFQFGKKFQSMNLFKCNNEGKDIKQEIKQQGLGLETETQLLFPEDLNMLGVTGVAVPPVGEERNMFNQSYLISSNNLFSIGEKLEAVLKINYMHDIQERFQNQRTEYIIAGSGNIVIEEKNRFRGCTNSPELDFVVKSNTAKSFFQNRINAKVRFSDDYTNTEGTNLVNQKARLRQYDLSEIFSFIKPLGKSIFNVVSNTNFRSLPQSLNICSGEMIQSVDHCQFQSNNKAGLLRAFGKFSTELNGGVNMTFQKMETKLTRTDQANQIDNLDWSFTEMFVNPQIRYESDAMRITIEAPVKLQNDRLRFMPGITMKYKFSPFLEGYLAYNYNTTHTDIADMNSSLMLVNYRSFTKGYNKMLESRNNTISVSGQYNNPLKLINIYGSVNYSLNVDGYATSVKYLDFYNVRTILPDEREQSAFVATMSAVKSFFDMPLLLSIKTDYSIFENSMIQQDKETFYNTYVLNVKPRIEATIHKRLCLDCNMNVSISRRSSEGNYNYKEKILTFNPYFLLGYKFSDRLRSQVKFDYYVNEMSDGNYSDCLFTDLQAVYKLGKGEISVGCTNIFNKRSYSYTYFNEMATIDREFRLRPWNLMLSYSFTL